MHIIIAFPVNILNIITLAYTDRNPKVQVFLNHSIFKWNTYP